MAFITDDIIAYLGSHASITPLIETDPLHIFAEAVPKQISNSSGRLVDVGDTYIILEEDGGDKERDMDGFTGTREPRFNVLVASTGKQAVRQIFLALDEALDTHHVQMQDFWVEQSFFAEPRDVSERPQDGSGSFSYMMEATLSIIGRL